MCVAAWHLSIVGQVLENKALIKSPERRCQIRQIVRRANDQPVRLTDRIQYRLQPVPAYALSLELLLLASEARDAAGLLLESEQVESLYSCTCSLCTL